MQSLIILLINTLYYSFPSTQWWLDQILGFTLETSLLPTLKREDFYTSLAYKDCFYDLNKALDKNPNKQR